MIPILGLVLGFIALGFVTEIKNELISDILVTVGNFLVIICAMLMLKRTDNAILTYYYGFFIGGVIVGINFVLVWIKDDDNWWRFG